MPGTVWFRGEQVRDLCSTRAPGSVGLSQQVLRSVDADAVTPGLDHIVPAEFAQGPHHDLADGADGVRQLLLGQHGDQLAVARGGAIEQMTRDPLSHGGEGGATDLGRERRRALAQLVQKRPCNADVAVRQPAQDRGVDAEQVGGDHHLGRHRHDERFGVQRQDADQCAAAAVPHGERAAVGRGGVHPDQPGDDQLDVALAVTDTVQRLSRRDGGAPRPGQQLGQDVRRQAAQVRGDDRRLHLLIHQ